MLSKQDLPKYPQFVPESNSETIFAFRFDETNYSAWYGLSSMFATIDGVGWGEMYVSDKYIQHIQKFPQDVRNQFIVPNYKLDKTEIKHQRCIGRSLIIPISIMNIRFIRRM